MLQTIDGFVAALLAMMFEVIASEAKQSLRQCETTPCPSLIANWHKADAYSWGRSVVVAPRSGSNTGLPRPVMRHFDNELGFVRSLFLFDHGQRAKGLLQEARFFLLDRMGWMADRGGWEAPAPRERTRGESLEAAGS
jgi:hypothetical protein